MRRIFPVLFVALTVSAVVSCSGAEKTKTPEAVTEQPVEKAVEAPEQKEAPDQGEGVVWAEKTHDQQKAYMKMTVKPQMAKLFGDFDGEKFADFKCSACHGSSIKEGNFEMPNPELPKLDNFEKLAAEEPEMMEFMKTKVLPEMATLLGQQPYDPETKTGFGCFGCHTR